MHSYHSVSLCFLSTRHVLPQRRRLQADRSRMKVRETKGTKETKGTCCVIEQYCLSGIKYIKCIKCIKCIETDGMISILFNFCSTTFVPRLLFHERRSSKTFVWRKRRHLCKATTEGTWADAWWRFTLLLASVSNGGSSPSNPNVSGPRYGWT